MKNTRKIWRNGENCVFLHRFLTIAQLSLFHGVMVALEFLVLSVAVRISVEQLIKRRGNFPRFFVI